MDAAGSFAFQQLFRQHQRQHGLPALRVADLVGDVLLLKESQQAAQALLALDSDLRQHEAIRRRVEELFHENAGTLN